MAICTLKNCKGVAIIPFIIVISMVLFVGLTFLLIDQQNLFKSLLGTQNLEAQKNILTHLEEILIDELALRNSRFSTNADFYKCLYASPSPCDETQSYDMILYSPNPPIFYQGGSWPAPPAGIAKIAGGLSTNKVFYSRSGSICNTAQTQADNNCPLQVIVQFKPVCGGTLTEPQLGGTCGRANALDVIIGVGVYRNGIFKYNNDTSSNGDAKTYRIKATSLLN